MITSINDRKGLDKIERTAKNMNLNILEKSEKDKVNKGKEYTVYTLDISVDESSKVKKKWNVPHLTIYGTLPPNTKELVENSPGMNLSKFPVHTIIYGENVTKDQIIQSVEDESMFQDDQRNILSEIETADYT